MEISPEDKRDKISKLKEKKEVLQFKVCAAFQKLDTLRQAHYRAEEEYVKVKKLYERIDREEKLLFFSLPENNGCKKKKPAKTPTKDEMEKAKKNALSALNQLPKAVRDQIIANLK